MMRSIGNTSVLVVLTVACIGGAEPRPIGRSTETATLLESAEHFARAVRARDVDRIMAFVDEQGVGCVDTAVTRVEVERQIRTRGTWLHAFLLDPVLFRKSFADQLFTASLAELASDPELTIVVSPGQASDLVCVNFARSSSRTQAAELCFSRKRGRWVLGLLPNCV